MDEEVSYASPAERLQHEMAAGAARLQHHVAQRIAQAEATVVEVAGDIAAAALDAASASARQDRMIAGMSSVPMKGDDNVVMDAGMPTVFNPGVMEETKAREDAEADERANGKKKSKKVVEVVPAENGTLDDDLAGLLA